MRLKIFFIFFIIFAEANFIFAQSPQFVYDDHGRRDPLWKLVSPSGSILSYETDILISEMTLEGIIYDPLGKSFAIINSHIVKQSDHMGSYLVYAIEPQKVILLKGQDQFILELKKEE